MRFKEAYQMIDAALLNANLSVPVTPALKALTFDRWVQTLGKKHVRNVSVETLTGTVTNRYVMSNSDYAGQIIKVEQDGKIIPFLGEKNGSTDSDSDTVTNLGYWTREQTDIVSTSLTLTADTTTGVTTPAHGLEDGDFIRISEVVGFLSATGTLSEFNGVRHEVVSASTNEFGIAIDSSGYAVAQVGTSGLIRYDNKLLLFNKNTSADNDIKVYYYSAPRPKSSIESEVDVPELLIWASVYRTVAEFLNIDGKLQVASGFRGLAKESIDEYLEESRNREPQFDRLVLHMQEFNV